MRDCFEDLKSLCDEASDLVQVMRPDGILLYMNQTWRRILGHDSGENRISTDSAFTDSRDSPPLSFQAVLNPEDRDRFESCCRELQSDGATCCLQLTLQTAHGDAVHVEGKMRYRLDETGLPQIWCLWRQSASTADQALRRVEARYSLTTRILATIARGEPLEAILTALMTAIETQLEGSFASILLLTPEGTVESAIAPHLPKTYQQVLLGCRVGEGMGSCGTAAFRRQRVIVEDIASDPLWKDFRDLALSHGLQACWSTPIVTSEGKLLGTFGVYYAQVRSPQSDELEILANAATIASIAVERHQAKTTIARQQTELYQQMQQMNQALEAKVAEQTAELLIDERKLDGTPIISQADDIYLYDEQGLITGQFGVQRDITDQERAQAEILRTLQRERELHEMKSRFVSMMSHEFRTPLAVIQSAADLLQIYGPELESDQEYFQQIHTAIKHMTRMLDDVLWIGKAELGQLKIQRKPIDATAFCQEIIREFELAYGQSDRFQFNSSGAAHPVGLDQNLLRQILNNLLSNAVKYSPDHSPVDLRLVYHSDQVQLQVQDYGIGIPEGDRQRLFEPFYRAKNVDTIQGTGLGLAIVKHCVDLHHGHILLESQVGVGTTFTVVLPY